MDSIVIKNLYDEAILQIVEMDCSPLPNERDSIYLNFYRFFRDTCWVAVLNNEVIGFALGMIDQTNTTHCYLNYLFVKSEHRKNGLGRKLLSQFERSANRKGCKIVTLLTGKIENIDYYKKQGYEQNHDLQQFREDDAVYNYYYNKKKVSLLVKNLYAIIFSAIFQSKYFLSDRLRSHRNTSKHLQFNLSNKFSTFSPSPLYQINPLNLKTFHYKTSDCDLLLPHSFSFSYLSDYLTSNK